MDPKSTIIDVNAPIQSKMVKIELLYASMKSATNLNTAEQFYQKAAIELKLLDTLRLALAVLQNGNNEAAISSIIHSILSLSEKVNNEMAEIRSKEAKRSNNVLTGYEDKDELHDHICSRIDRINLAINDMSNNVVYFSGIDDTHKSIELELALFATEIRAISKFKNASDYAHIYNGLVERLHAAGVRRGVTKCVNNNNQKG